MTWKAGKDIPHEHNNNRITWALAHNYKLDINIWQKLNNGSCAWPWNNLERVTFSFDKVYCNRVLGRAACVIFKILDNEQSHVCAANVHFWFDIEHWTFTYVSTPNVDNVHSRIRLVQWMTTFHGHCCYTNLCECPMSNVQYSLFIHYTLFFWEYTTSRGRLGKCVRWIQ